MNSLNLRVSSVKTGENVKKNADIRAELITLPKHYAASEESYCLDLKYAKTIPEQVAMVKNIFKNLSSDSQALQFLADLYFYCPLKHPVRNQILKLLITAARLGTGNVDESSIVNALSCALQRLVDETKLEIESSKWNCTITSLTGCFENFECGLAAIKHCVPFVFPFLCAAVQKYLTELSVLSSPSVRNDYYLYIHNSIRLILSCVQEFTQKIKESHSEQMKHLNSICKEIIQDDEIPMDPRTNSGILMAHIAKIYGDYDVFIEEVKHSMNANDIALCVGIVNTFDQHDFQRISADIRDICSKIDEIANANGTIPSILLCASRSLYQISKMILNIEFKSQTCSDDAKLILRKLLIFTFGYLEHHMDSVRHICRDLLRNIVAAATRIHFDFLLQKIYDACNSERLSLSMKCVVLQQAAFILGAEEIIKNCPELFTCLFAVHLGRDFIVNHLFEALMTTSHKELCYDIWFNLWINYLLEIAAANDSRLPDIENLIVKAVKCEPKIVQHIIDYNDGPISTKLSALWAVRKLGIKMENFNGIMQNFSKSLLFSILSNSDETRIMALRLIVETHKTTEMLTRLECENLLTFLEYNSNCQSPATRQKMLGLLGKALMRCEVNLMKVLKDQPNKSKNGSEGEKQHTEAIKIMSSSSSSASTSSASAPVSSKAQKTEHTLPHHHQVAGKGKAPSSILHSHAIHSQSNLHAHAPIQSFAHAQSHINTHTPYPHAPSPQPETLTTTTPPQHSSPTHSNTAASTQQPLQLQFLHDFIQILIKNLFQGANFSRRTISLQLLEQSLRICINCNLNFDKMLPKTTISTLIDTLSDTYESNKELAVTILKLIENQLNLNLIENDQMHINLDDMQTLLTSMRPTDSVTAAYQLEFFCNRAKPETFGDYDLTEYNPRYYAALRWLLLELKAGLNMAKKSILQAAKYNPLYGLAFAIKHLLMHLDFHILAKELAWRIIIAELILLCKELTTVVAPIVNNSSPEGHLPNDFSELPAELREQHKEEQKENQEENENKVVEEGTEKNSTIETNFKILSSRHNHQHHHHHHSNIKKPKNLHNIKTTPQMVLLCAWRTVKEVSLILGEIVSRSPIQFSKLTEEFLITKEQILEIGEHFKQLLAETKHRGAFEQAYIGFSKLCCRLWRVEALDLNTLPMQWLRELITLISKDQQLNEKICATRRSAGVPFMVQALITAELQVGSSKSLHYCMSHLLQLCVIGSRSANQSAESRTHAMNILRALFRCTDLNEAVGEYISDGLICSIRGYDADTWSEKNAATLLFASLMTRIFGVQRTKDSENLNIRNKMTGRIFFLRYPKLYDFFLLQLRAASDLIVHQQKANKLHPLLLILSRLYPSALEGTESNLKLSEFIPCISDCSSCPEMQTRFLAAKAIVALISKDAVTLTILRKCSDIVYSVGNRKEINHNILHGQLLQILLLLKSYKIIDGELIGDISCTLIFLYESKQITNAVILKAIMDIFIQILKGLKSLTYTQETIQNLLYFSTQKLLTNSALSYYYPVLRKSFYIYNLHTLRLTLPFGALSDYLLNPSLTRCDGDNDADKDMKLETVECCLNVILLILYRHAMYEEWSNGGSSAAADDDNNREAADADIAAAAGNEIAMEFEISDDEVQFVYSLDRETLYELGLELRQSKNLYIQLRDIIQKSSTLYYPECTMKSYAILSLVEHFDFTLNYLIKESKKHPGDVKSSLTMCVERLVAKQGIDSKLTQNCLEYLMEIAQPWHPDCLRLKASKILTHIAVHYTKALEKKKLQFIRLYIGLMLALLMDEDYEIRDNTAKIVLNNLQDDIEIQNVVSIMATRLFLQSTADILLAMKADDTYILEIFKIITETLNPSSLHGDSGGSGDDVSQNSNNNSTTSSSSSSTGGGVGDLDVFDKNEANVFAEPIKVIYDSVVVFRKTFYERPKVVHFIDEYKVCHVY